MLSVIALTDDNAVSDCFMLDLHTTKLDYETLVAILHSGNSRIPVFEITTSHATGKAVQTKKILGVILTKQFILLDPEGAP